jgi:hypothetical protein
MNQLPNDQQQQARLDAAEELTRATIVNTPLNTKYTKEVKKFKKWVLDHPEREQELHVILPNHYITKASIETFYLEHEKDRIVQHPTLLKTVYALNRLAAAEDARDVKLDDHSYDIREGTTGKVVKSVIEHVRGEYERDLQAKEVNVHAVENDPYRIINQQEVSDVMLTQLKGAKNHNVDAITAWAITTTTLMRFDSASIVTIDKLKVVEDLPPHGIYTPFDGEKRWASSTDPDTDSRLLGIIVPPADQKKKNNQAKKPEGVGAYRHKRFERCAIGLIAFAFFDKCSRTGAKISFLKREHVPANKVHWKDVKLFDLNYGTAHNQYARMLENAGVGKWKKVTHMISTFLFMLCYSCYATHYYANELCYFIFYIIQKSRLQLLHSTRTVARRNQIRFKTCSRCFFQALCL